MPRKPSTSSPDIPPYASAGKPTSEIDVRISYRIIQLFSEGLYSSPNKALEELVSNGFDAGAENVHVLMSSDLGDESSTIVVIDDGEGMDPDGLATHWIIGESAKRNASFVPPKGRKQIGRFGIGKLATYVLARRLSHITKVRGKYYATSMDYSAIPDTSRGAGALDETVTLPVRTLSAAEAREALKPWISGDKEGFEALRLFGKGASKSWTVAVMSDLRDMVQQLRPGRLKWVLATAMPLRTDFNLFLNGDRISSSKLKGKTIGRWQIGKGALKQIPKPAPDDLEQVEDPSHPAASLHRIGLTHAELGRVTGRVELYEDLLTQGKAAEFGRSHGFFVYVRGRLVNADDEYFGISSNALRHGTFSRFRCEVHMDRIDDELRSSRESVRETSLVETARNILQGVFNFARKKHEEHEEREASGRRATQRLSDTPANLARTPLRHIVARALSGKASPAFIRYPRGLSESDQAAFLETLEEKAESSEGLVQQIVQAPLGQHVGIAVFDSETGVLQINSLHPFVAYFGDEFSSKTQNLPLELLATSEVLLEATMYESGMPEARIQEVMGKRDTLLRELARSTGKRNALMISQDIQNASTNQSDLESEVIAGFDSMGYDAVPIGGPGKRDGLAQAHLSGAGVATSSYSVSVEARAKLKPGREATAATIASARIIKQRDATDTPCDHAVVVVADFPKKKGPINSVVKQLDADADDTGKTVTFVTVTDFARLVRLTPAKRLGLDRLREWCKSCRLPEESRKWIDEAARSVPSDAPYREILEAIAEEQRDLPDQMVEYSQLEVLLRKVKGTVIARDEIVGLCMALHRIVPEYVYASDQHVAIMSRPDRILDAFNATIKHYPEADRPTGEIEASDE